MPFGTENLAVWHIPKTGGMWLREAMIRSGLDVQTIGEHHAAYDAESELKRRLHNAVIVREPVAWYSSCWRWMRKNEMADLWFRLFPRLTDACLDDFAYFVGRNAGSWSRAVASYSPPGCVMLRTERLANDAALWLRQSGEMFNETELRKTPPQNVTKEPGPPVSAWLSQQIHLREAFTP